MKKIPACDKHCIVPICHCVYDVLYFQRFPDKRCFSKQCLFLPAYPHSHLSGSPDLRSVNLRGQLDQKMGLC